jgi:hypothetical protein
MSKQEIKMNERLIYYLSLSIILILIFLFISTTSFSIVHVEANYKVGKKRCKML